MAQITENASGANVPTFLDLIAWAEGTSTQAITKARGYDIIVGGIKPDTGIEIFTDFSKHPFEPSTAYPLGRTAKLIYMDKGEPVRSSASGRYQIIQPVWENLKRMCRLSDFSPISQDLAAIELLRELRDGNRIPALEHIVRGDIQAAITLAGRTWASFPTTTTIQGNGPKTMADMLAQFAKLRAAA